MKFEEAIKMVGKQYIQEDFDYEKFHGTKFRNC